METKENCSVLKAAGKASKRCELVGDLIQSRYVLE
jgi:hypothetical protein